MRWNYTYCMNDQQIKTKLLNAVKSASHIVDIKSVALFGSYINGKANENSDVDVLIDFLPTAKVGFFKLAQIKRHLQEALGKEVDLLTPQALSKFFREDVLQNAEYFYER